MFQKDLYLELNQTTFVPEISILRSLAMPQVRLQARLHCASDLPHETLSVTSADKRVILPVNVVPG